MEGGVIISLSLSLSLSSSSLTLLYRSIYDKEEEKRDGMICSVLQFIYMYGRNRRYEYDIDQGFLCLKVVTIKLEPLLMICFLICLCILSLSLS